MMPGGVVATLKKGHSVKRSPLDPVDGNPSDTIDEYTLRAWDEISAISFVVTETPLI
jgi:hypothetical protein